MNKKRMYDHADYLRNPEIRRQLVAFLLFGIMAEGGSLLLDRSAVLPIFLLWLFMGILH